MRKCPQRGVHYLSDRDHVVSDEGAVEARDEAGLDVPLHAQALRKLSRRDRTHYQVALDLLSSGSGVRALLQEGDLPLAGLGIYEALLARSWDIRFQDKGEMVFLAQVAVEVASNFDSKVYGEKDIGDLKARAWGELANAYRAADQLRSADRAFGYAYAFFAQGTGNPYLKVRLFDLSASLFGTWREFSLADERLKVVADLYRELGEQYLAGRALITRALYTFYSGQPEEALLLNKQGKALIEARRDPALFLMAVHNDLLFLVDLGRYMEAKRALFDSRQHFIYSDHANALRLRWIEGRIDYGLRNLVSSEIAFREVREGMVKLGLSFHVALASLDLAMVLLSQDRFAEAEKEVLAARDLFLTVEVYREFLGAVIFLEEVFRRRTVTPAMIEATVAHIWRKNLRVCPRHYR